MSLSLPFIQKVEPRAFHFEEITLEQLQAKLQISKGAKIISLVSITKPNLIKCKKPTYESEYEENPYYDNCVKVSKINCIVNFHYSNSVNNQLKREGKEPDFIPQPRKWGDRLTNSPFVSHVTKDGKHKLYLETKIEKSLSHCYYDSSNGLLIPEEKITPWLKEVKKSQNTNKEIILRDYDVSNIAVIIIDKENFIIKENIK